MPSVFEEFRAYLSAEALHTFDERAAREWGIETGQIERAFDIERGVAVTLIEQGFNSSLIQPQSNGLSGEQVDAILRDTKEALDGLFDFIKSKEPLTTSYIRQLQQQLMRHVDTYDGYTPDGELVKQSLGKGEYKRVPNNPSRNGKIAHVYCPPEQVEGQMEELVRIFNGLDEAVWPPEVRAAWLHHAFAQIHPFQDGNGRVARGLASLVLVKAGLAPLTVTRDMHPRYIRSLEAADEGRPQPLIDFFESAIYRQIVSLWRVLEVRTQVADLRSPTIEEIIAAAQAKLIAKHSLLPASWSKTDQSVVQLKPLIETRFRNLADELTRSLQHIEPNFGASYGQPNEFRGGTTIAGTEEWEPIESATAERWFSVFTLKINTGTLAAVHLKFDDFVENRKGLLGAVVSLFQEGRVDTIQPAFFINFKDAPRAAEFGVWLDAALKEALLIWQKGIA